MNNIYSFNQLKNLINSNTELNLEVLLSNNISSFEKIKISSLDSFTFKSNQTETIYSFKSYKQIIEFKDIKVLDIQYIDFDSNFIKISNCDKVIINNCNFINNGLQISDCKSVEINTINVNSKNYEDCITYSNCDTITIKNCNFSNANDECLDFKNGCNTITIEKCNFSYDGYNIHNFPILIGKNSEDKSTTEDGFRTVIIKDCTFNENCIGRMPRCRFSNVTISGCTFNVNDKTDYIFGPENSTFNVSGCTIVGSRNNNSSIGLFVKDFGNGIVNFS